MPGAPKALGAKAKRLEVLPAPGGGGEAGREGRSLLSGSFPWASLSRHQHFPVERGVGGEREPVWRKSEPGVGVGEGSPSPSSRAELPGLVFEERLGRERDEGKATRVYRSTRVLYTDARLFSRGPRRLRVARLQSGPQRRKGSGRFIERRKMQPVDSPKTRAGARGAQRRFPN